MFRTSLTSCSEYLKFFENGPQIAEYNNVSTVNIKNSLTI